MKCTKCDYEAEEKEFKRLNEPFVLNGDFHYRSICPICRRTFRDNRNKTA